MKTKSWGFSKPKNGLYEGWLKNFRRKKFAPQMCLFCKGIPSDHSDPNTVFLHKSRSNLANKTLDSTWSNRWCKRYTPKIEYTNTQLVSPIFLYMLQFIVKISHLWKCSYVFENIKNKIVKMLKIQRYFQFSLFKCCYTAYLTNATFQNSSINSESKSNMGSIHTRSLQWVTCTYLQCGSASERRV